MEYRVSEWGNPTIFDCLADAINYCLSKNLTDGEEGCLWITGESRREMNEWKNRNQKEIDDEYMFITYKSDDVLWIWDSIDNKWVTYEDFQKDDY